VGLFQKEPAVVLGTLGTVAVAAYAKWQGLEVEDVLVQIGGLVATFLAIRAKVTPAAEKVVNRVRDLRNDDRF